MNHAESHDKIRICHIVLLADLSGSKRSMIEILKHLDDHRYEKYVISNGQGELTTILETSHINSLPVSLTRHINPINDLKAFFLIYFLCRKYKFHVVHTHSSKTGIIGRIAARLAGVKVVIHHVRGYAFHEYSSRCATYLISVIEKFAGWFCDRVIFVNDEERTYSICKKILPEYKCITILNGIDFQIFDKSQKPLWRKEIRNALNIPDTSVIITFAGRLCHQKNPLVLRDTIISYLNDSETDTYFLILGDGPCFLDMNNCFKQYSWNNRVLLLGWINNLERYFAASDIFFLPSLWEGMPRTILEAMSMGLPIVCSNIKGNREAVTDNINGYIAGAKDVAAFSKLLRDLADNPETRINFGNNAYHKAVIHYNSKINSHKIIDLYEQLLYLKINSFKR